MSDKTIGHLFSTLMDFLNLIPWLKPENYVFATHFCPLRELFVLRWVLVVYHQPIGKDVLGNNWRILFLTERDLFMKIGGENFLQIVPGIIWEHLIGFQGYN